VEVNKAKKAIKALKIHTKIGVKWAKKEGKTSFFIGVQLLINPC